MNKFTTTILLGCLITLSHTLCVPELYAGSRFDGKIPQQLWTAKIIPLGKPSIKTQSELDEDLVNQVQVDRYYKYQDFNNYVKVARIIAEGAYISEKALLSAISKHYRNDTAKDFKSFQLLYLNGEFEPDVFDILDCNDLKNAVTAQIRTSGTNKKNAHTNAEQVTLFLADKVEFKKCKNLLPAVTANEYLFEINLNVAKILLDQGVDTKDILLEAIKTSWEHTTLYGYSDEIIARGRKETLARYMVIKFLVNEGIKPEARHLEEHFSEYIDFMRRPQDIPTQKTIQLQFSRITKLLLASGVTPNKETEELFVKYRKTIARLKEKIASSNSKRGKKEMQYAISLYPTTIKLFETEGNLDVDSTVKTNELAKQLHEAVVAKDKRRASFYLKKGAQGRLATLRQAIINDMDKVATTIMDQKIDFDPHIIALLAIQYKSPELVTYLLEKNKIQPNNSEQLMIAAAENRYSQIVQALIANGANSEKAIELAIDKYGSKYPSQIIATSGNAQCKTIFNEFKEEEARQSKLAKERAETERRVREQQYQQQQENERQQYLAQKRRGDMVCKDGRMAIFLNITITAYVEEADGNKIRIRIADTEGVSPHYNGVTLNKNTVIWDDYQEWRKCN